MTHDIDATRALVQEATARLIRTVDGLSAEQLAEPSGLPDWTRAHVVAHLALNSEGLAGALAGIGQEEPQPMYASQEARDGDIADLATADPAELRDRLLAGSTLFDDAVASVPEDGWSTQVERTPGGRTFTAASTPGMRLREVEIHHVDLDAGYTPDAWPAEFCRLLLDGMAKRPSPTSFTVDPVDLDGTWSVGEGSGPTVTGPAWALGWWLTGRGDSGELSSSDGTLPEVAPW